jgi:hypothetical protein
LFERQDAVLNLRVLEQGAPDSVDVTIRPRRPRNVPQQLEPPDSRLEASTGAEGLDNGFGHSWDEPLCAASLPTEDS